MQNGFDMDTGELPLSTSAKALEAQVVNRREARREERGVGQVGLYEALAMAHRHIPTTIINDAASGQRYRYATLKQLLEVVRKPLLDVGIIIKQGTENAYRIDEGGGHKLTMVPVFTDLVHVRTGELVRTKIDIPIVKPDPQAVGSAVTYGKRYTLMAGLGIATDDDDDAASAKPNDLSEKDPAKPLLDAIKKLKKLDELAKWRNDNDFAIKRLNEADFEKVKIAFVGKREELSESEQ